MEYNELRMSICGACEHYNNIIKTCRICSCFMPAKTMFKTSVCPADPPKWLALQGPDTTNNSCCNKGQK